MKNFAIAGVGGFVAPRHLKAINDTNNVVVAAVDPNDSVGIIDSYFTDAQFFTDPVRFQRHIEKLRYKDSPEKIDYMSICTPNHVHDAYIRMALRNDANAICEKPLVVSPWNLDPLLELQEETGRKVYNTLQLRLHPDLIATKQKLDSQQNRKKVDVVLTYITRRGNWYHISWKGQEEKSGGLAMNIGIHFFDLLMWYFGNVEFSEVHHIADDKMAGYLELEWARVSWILSIDRTDLPEGYRKQGKYALRSITIDGDELEFSGGFTDLHTRVYEHILSGQGFGMEIARPSIELVHQIRTSEVATNPQNIHPILKDA